MLSALVTLRMLSGCCAQGALLTGHVWHDIAVGGLHFSTKANFPVRDPGLDAFLSTVLAALNLGHRCSMEAARHLSMPLIASEIFFGQMECYERRVSPH